jgi:two-component system response regulator FixJ
VRLLADKNVEKGPIVTSNVVVYVVEDDEESRSSVCALVQSNGWRTSAHASAEEFLEKFDPAMPGCLIADVRLSGMSGLHLQRLLEDQRVRLPVIIITAYGDIPMAVQALRRGAVTFLEKPCVENELLDAIEEALERSQTNRRQFELVEELRVRRETLAAGEVDVLKKVIAGLPNKQIAATLDIGLRTVELRRANILKKMRANSLAELIRFAILLGIDFEDDERD